MSAEFTKHRRRVTFFMFFGGFGGIWLFIEWLFPGLRITSASPHLHSGIDAGGMLLTSLFALALGYLLVRVKRERYTISVTPEGINGRTLFGQRQVRWEDIVRIQFRGAPVSFIRVLSRSPHWIDRKLFGGIFAVFSTPEVIDASLEQIRVLRPDLLEGMPPIKWWFWRSTADGPS